ncbi:MAG: hypothetical protein ABL920_08525 [Methylotenera sp.]
MGKLRLRHPTKTALRANIHAGAGAVGLTPNATGFQIKFGMTNEIAVLCAFVVNMVFRHSENREESSKVRDVKKHGFFSMLRIAVVR